MTAQHKPAEHGRGEVGEQVAPLHTKMIEMLRKALDANTDDESLWTLVNRAANALYWRGKEIEELRAAIAALTQPKDELLWVIGQARALLGKVRKCDTVNNLHNVEKLIAFMDSRGYRSADKIAADVSLPRQSEAEPVAIVETDSWGSPKSFVYTGAIFGLGAGKHNLYTTPPAAQVEADIYEAYKSWPEDIRKKLSLHDLRRMSGWAPRPNPTDWRIDHSAGGPILVYQNCSVIQDEQARYVLGLIDKDTTTSAAHVVGDGMVAVPRKATKVMVEAGRDQARRISTYDSEGFPGYVTTREIYDAMIQAAAAPGGCHE